MTYQRQTWNNGRIGGTPITAARLTHREQGIFDARTRTDQASDAVAALIAAAQSGTPFARINGGPTANRPAPTLNTIYRDTDLGKVIYGGGTAWVYEDGSVVTSASGTPPPAPANFTAITQPNNSIICTWSPVPNATYNLYEIQSPLGVTGATGLTATIVTRTPGVNRTYEYWVTAVVGGTAGTVQTPGVGGVSPPAGAILATADSGDLNITTSGTAASPRVYDGQGHTCGRVTVTADYVTVQNFNIRPGSQYGAYLTGNNITLQNNDIKEIMVSGDGDLNAITLFGDNIHILYNTCINFVSGDPGGSHTDAIQTWNTPGKRSTSGLWVIGNRFEGPLQSEGGAPIHQCIMGEGAQSTDGGGGGSGISQNWHIEGNYFRDSWNQAIKVDDIDNVTVTRNTFAGNSDHILEVTALSTGVKYYSDNTVTGNYLNGVGYTITAGAGPVNPLGSGIPPTPGLESAASNHGICVLPYAPPSGGGGLSADSIYWTYFEEMAYEITSTAENSRKDWYATAVYGYIEDIGDDRGYTAGIVGFCTGTGDLYAMIQHYVAIKPTGNQMSTYLDELATLADEGEGPSAGSRANSLLGATFRNLWANLATNDPLFRQAQRDYKEDHYWRPAFNAAVADGVRGFGLAVLYDISINHGEGTDSESFGGIVAAARSRSRPPSAGGSETGYIQALIDIRAAVLTSWGDNPSDGRVAAHRALLATGNLTLSVPFSWNMYSEPFSITTRPDLPAEAARPGGLQPGAPSS